MRKIIFLTVSILTCLAQAKTRVGVVDTGYSGASTKLCADGHYDFIENLPMVGKDHRDHGTKVVDLIEQYAGEGDYCFVIYKVFPDKSTGDAGRIVKALKMANANKIDVLNLSYNGEDSLVDEQAELLEATYRGAKLFMSSGNDDADLDVKCNTYPACYKVPGANVIGGYERSLKAGPNYGKVVTRKERFCNPLGCGTSFSTAIATGKSLRRSK